MVGDAPGHDAGGQAGEGVSAGGLRGVAEEDAVLLGGAADEDAGTAAAQGQRVDAGAFEGLPGHLQEQSLLGVHREGLAGRDTEEGGVEVAGPGKEGAPVAGVVGRVVFPAAIGGRAGHDVAALGDQPPQVVRVVHAVGEAAADADDGQRLRGGGGEPLIVPAQPLVLQEGGAQRVDDLVERCVVHASGSHSFCRWWWTLWGCSGGGRGTGRPPPGACLTIPVVARRAASRRQARALGVPGTGPRTGCTWVCARCGERACMASRGRRELSDRP